MSKNLSKLTTLFLLCVAAAFFLGRLASQQENTLFNGNNWNSTKIVLGKSAVGSIAFFVTRTALFQDRLNLGAWHGYQEIVSKKKFSLSQISFETELGDRSAISFWFEHGPEGAKGIRLSSNENYKSEYLEVDSYGTIIVRTDLRDHLLLPNKKQQIQISFENKLAQISVNNNFVGNVSYTVSGPSHIGFRAEADNTYIDTIKITGTDGKTFVEKFSPANFWLYFTSVFGALFLAMMCIKIKYEKTNSKSYLAESIALAFLSAGSVLFLADYYYFAGAYPAVESGVYDFNKYQIPTHFEMEDEALRRINSAVENLPKDAAKIILLGASQTWGSGALTEQKQLGVFLEEKLKKKNPESIFVNAGISGIDVKKMRLILESLPTKNIKTVILNASYNDIPLEFKEQLRLISDYAKSKDIRMVFVKEASSFLDMSSDILEKHQFMQEFGDLNGITVIDAHQKMKDVHSRGYFWWDRVHMSSAGQEILADIILSAF